MLATGGDDRFLRIYSSNGISFFSISQTISIDFDITQVIITNDKKMIIVGGRSNDFEIFTENNQLYSNFGTVRMDTNSEIIAMDVSDDYETLVKRVEALEAEVAKKKTVKKPLVKSVGRSIVKSLKKNEIMMQDANNRSYVFELNGDREIFESRIVLPSIPMDCDNDTESEWGDIDANVKSLAL